jgi:hypothetical protein
MACSIAQENKEVRTMEKKMRSTRSFIAIISFMFVMVGLPSAASAQSRDRDDDYWRGGRSGRNINGVVVRLENRARNFERQVDRIDDRRDDRRDDRWGTRRDRFDDLDVLARRFKNAAENLRDEYERGRNMNSSRDEARRLLDLGSQIDQVLYRARGSRNTNIRYVENDWNQISNDLRIVAQAYGMNYNGRGGNWRDRMPIPWPF